MFKFELTEAEANLMLSLVAKGPFDQVFQLVQKLQQQAQGQLEQKPQEAPE